MHYPCSENKGADQLRGYREADLRLCFRICRLLVFPCGGSFYMSHGTRKHVFGISNQVQHRLVYTPTEEIYNLEILDISREGIVLSGEKSGFLITRLIFNLLFIP